MDSSKLVVMLKQLVLRVEPTKKKPLRPSRQTVNGTPSKLHPQDQLLEHDYSFFVCFSSLDPLFAGTWGGRGREKAGLGQDKQLSMRSLLACFSSSPPHLLSYRVMLCVPSPPSPSFLPSSSASADSDCDWLRKCGKWNFLCNII